MRGLAAYRARATPPTTSPRRWSTPTWTASRSPTPSWRRSSSCWWWPATRPPATPSATACGRFTEHPDQRAVWAADFDTVAPTAVDEIVRWASPVIFMRRTTTAADHAVGPRLRRRRQGASSSTTRPTATRTSSTDPQRFDVLRHPNPHVGFGAPGPHFCLGAHLARREITVMFRELFRHLPDIRATGRARPAAVELHQRHQAPALRVLTAA